jgi:hypothetical protein
MTTSVRLRLKTDQGETLELRRLDGYWFSHRGQTFTATWNPRVALWEVSHVHELTGVGAVMTRAVDMEDAVQEAMDVTETLARRVGAYAGIKEGN